MEKLDPGMMNREKRAFPIWKRRSFRFGSDLGCCPSFFRYNFNSRKFPKSPSAGDDITKKCSHTLQIFNFISSSLYSHQLFQQPKFIGSGRRKPALFGSSSTRSSAGKLADQPAQGSVFCSRCTEPGFSWITTP